MDSDSLKYSNHLKNSDLLKDSEAVASFSDTHLAATEMLDFKAPSIQSIVESRGWKRMVEFDRIGAVYAFVRDEVPFGYSLSDVRSASEVLADGLGQCNTKTTLLMALLRASGIPCRLHGAAIHKELQKGIVNGLFYRLAPAEILHTWAEVLVDGRWVGLEGVILDGEFLDGLRMEFPAEHEEFLGYAVGTLNLASPPVDWDGQETTIQSTGLSFDYGIFDSPDSFYREVSPTITGLKDLLFRHVIRHTMNRNARRVRATGRT